MKLIVKYFLADVFFLEGLSYIWLKYLFHLAGILVGGHLRMESSCILIFKKKLNFRTWIMKNVLFEQEKIKQ
jgi:hypothetical protein